MDMNRPTLLALGLALSCSLVSFLGGCAAAGPTRLDAPFAPVDLMASDGARYTLPARDGETRVTVLVFSAWHCPCQAAHDPRLRDLYARYHERGVAFFAVDSETGGNAGDDAARARERGYDFPVLLDPGAALARTLHAEYATEAFVVDREGRVRYHGGLDSDQKKLHDDAEPLLANALDDLLQGKSPRTRETKALGCALQTW
jgi:peroxiredoxin